MRLKLASLAVLLVPAALVSACAQPEATSTPCHSVVTTDPMPAWADGGFSEGARVPHVFGADDRIVAVPFAGTLVATGQSAPRNKVLLVARESIQQVTPVTIDAMLDGQGDVVHREREIGPGSLDMPTAGCWRMTLTWGDQSDVIELEYVDEPQAG